MALLGSKKLLLILAVAIFYIAFIIHSDITHFSYRWSDLNVWYIPPILALQFAVILLRAFRQKLLFDSLDIKLTYIENLKIHLVGLSLIMTPGGFGQTIKSYYLKNKFDHPYTKTIAVSLAERYHDLLSIIPIMCFLLFFNLSAAVSITLLITSSILILIFLFIRNRHIADFIISKIPKIGIIRKIEENYKPFHDSAYIFTKKKLFVFSLIIGIISWVIAAIPFYLCFKAFGLNYSPIDTTLISFIPFTLGAISFIPGGVGITELGMLTLLTKYGLPVSLASYLTLFTRVTSIWFYTIIGFASTKFMISYKTKAK